MNMYETPHALSDYLDTAFTCSCGREHYAALKYVSIGKDALADLPRILAGLGKAHPYLICDEITWSIAGEKAMAILAQAGLSMANVVKTVIFLADINDFAAVNAVYAKAFAEPFPARSCVQVAAIPKGAKLEIECIAVRE